MFWLTSETPTAGSKPAKIGALPIELGGRLWLLGSIANSVRARKAGFTSRDRGGVVSLQRRGPRTQKQARRVEA